MPIYEYRCTNCGHEMDALQKISDPPLTDCPVCETTGLKRKLSAPGFRLKGSGWYETDFKTANRKNLHESADSAKPAANDASKPAAAPATAKPAAAQAA